MGGRRRVVATVRNSRATDITSPTRNPQINEVTSVLLLRRRYNGKIDVAGRERGGRRHPQHLARHRYIIPKAGRAPFIRRLSTQYVRFERKNSDTRKGGRWPIVPSPFRALSRVSRPRFEPTLPPRWAPLRKRNALQKYSKFFKRARW